MSLEGNPPRPAQAKDPRRLRKLAGVARRVQAVSKRPRHGLLLAAFGQQAASGHALAATEPSESQDDTVRLLCFE